jgi:hypothetical protein
MTGGLGGDMGGAHICELNEDGAVWRLAIFGLL